MSKTTKNSLIILIITIVIFALIVLGYQHFKSKPISTDNIVSGNLLPDLNKETINSVSENSNNNIENQEQNTETEEKNNINNSNTTNYIEDDNQITQKETKAINLAKAEWTKKYENIDGVEFNVSIQNNGKYLVTVYDTKTTRLIKGYIVDVDTEIVNEK